MIQKLKNYLWHWPKAVLASAWYGFPARKLTMIGVTGTKGKTTTAHMIYYILNRVYDPGIDDPRHHFFGTLGQEPSLTSSLSPGQSKSIVSLDSSSMTSKMAPSDHLVDRKVKLNGRVGLISTIGAFFGDEEIDTGLHVTSPDPRELQKLLKMAVDRGLTHVVIEVTSSGLDQFRVWGIKFRVAVITNIYPDHLDYHGTMEKYVSAKAKIIRQSETVVLPSSFASVSSLAKFARSPAFTCHSPSGTIRSRLMARFSAGRPSPIAIAPGKPLATLGVGVGANFANLAGTKLKIVDFKKDSPVTLMNKELAAAAVEALEIKSLKELKKLKLLKILNDFNGVKGRLEEVYKNKFSVVIDFAHTPESLAAALGELRPRVGKNGKLIAVFGCAGERDHGRRRMGQVAAEMADFFVITAEDPRSEKVEEISEEISGWARAAGGREVSQTSRDMKFAKLRRGYFVRISDRQEAINYAISLAKRGDVVGLFGKGHEKSMAFGKKELSWSEYEAVDRALKYVRNIRLRREK